MEQQQNIICSQMLNIKSNVYSLLAPFLVSTNCSGKWMALELLSAPLCSPARCWLLPLSSELLLIPETVLLKSHAGLVLSSKPAKRFHQFWIEPLSQRTHYQQTASHHAQCPNEYDMPTSVHASGQGKPAILWFQMGIYFLGSETSLFLIDMLGAVQTSVWKLERSHFHVSGKGHCVCLLFGPAWQFI